MKILEVIILFGLASLAYGQNQPGVVQGRDTHLVPAHNEPDRLMNEIRIHEQSHTFPEANSTRTQISPDSRANNTTTTTTNTDTTKW